MNTLTLQNHERRITITEEMVAHVHELCLKHDREFPQLMAEMRAEHREDMEEHRKRMDGMDSRFKEVMSQLRRHESILDTHTKMLFELKDITQKIYQKVYS